MRVYANTFCRKYIIINISLLPVRESLRVSYFNIYHMGSIRINQQVNNYTQNLHETTFDFAIWLLQRTIVLTYIERLNNSYLNGTVVHDAIVTKC